MGEKNQEALKLQFDRRLMLEFHGARITSDAGPLACRELDGALRLTEEAPTYLRETRGGRNVQHELVPLLRHLGARQELWRGGSRVPKGRTSTLPAVCAAAKGSLTASGHGVTPMAEGNNG